jgi:hypothetical protein
MKANNSKVMMIEKGCFLPSALSNFRLESYPVSVNGSASGSRRVIVDCSHSEECESSQPRHCKEGDLGADLVPFGGSREGKMWPSCKGMQRAAVCARGMGKGDVMGV